MLVWLDTKQVLANFLFGGAKIPKPPSENSRL